MEIDAEKLVSLVQERPILFNPRLKEYHDANAISKQWEEIGIQMNATGRDCLGKWKNLRNSYGRYLKAHKGLPSGSSSSKKRKWYLADAMEFLRDFMGIHRNSTSNLEEACGSMDENTSFEGASLEPDEPDESDTLHDASPVPAPRQPSLQGRSKVQTAGQQLVGPVSEYLRSKARQEEAADNPILQLVKGLMPDIVTLDASRTRRLRAGIVQLVCNLADEQELADKVSSSGGSSLTFDSPAPNEMLTLCYESEQI